MTFNQDKPIYLQMADRLMDAIVAGQYADESRIPSVRDFAVSLGVNSNTAMKAFDELSRANIIYNKRGLGYFVTPGASEQIREQRRREFISATLPKLFRDMHLLGISMEEVMKQYAAYKTTCA